MAASKIKASDRSKVCQQIVTILKKEYGSRSPSYDYDVLDTVLFSICLENSNSSDAQDALQRLKDNFYDYNELRVSSITEIQHAFVNMSEPEWRAMRARDVLQFVFENGYTYDIEDLKKKTMDSAEKHLKKIKSLTPFAISHTLLFALGSHLVPVSKTILSTSMWLGLLEPKTKIKAAGEQLKGAVRKSDVPLFYYLLSVLAADAKYQKLIDTADAADSDNPLEALKKVPSRLKDLIAGKIKASRKPKVTKTKTAKKTEKPASKSKKKPESKKKTTTKKTAKPATTKKKPVTKTATAKKKTAKKKATTKKTAAKKPATKKGSVKKTAPPKKKPTAKKSATAKKVVKKATKKKGKTTKKSRR